MISTSLAAVLVGLSAVATVPNWQTDYQAALARVSAEHKPVAVFIAPGPNGYAKVVTEGQLGADATGLLSRQYVALHIDPTTPAGQRTARSFGMNEGLVISDRTGGVQAYRHAGPLSQAELTSSLRVFAEATPAVVPVSTSTSFYQAPVSVAPVISPAPVFSAPQPVLSPASVFAPAPSSCPNGRCPNAR